ncbi:MAG: transcriptional regulator [Rhodobacteraceae bacterium HLUCCA08]|nr:MAG: transcriptional regulator [Rhodobacteraceae bacterium HLUCCA08]
MQADHQTSDRIAELLIHIGRLARSAGSGSALTAAQWTCLRFFARANANTRTPSGFASFQATTRGTASQIVKSLEGLGLVTRNRSDRDRRSVVFDLTGRGRAMLAQDPLGDLVEVIRDIDAADQDHVLAILSRLAAGLTTRRDCPAFGSCRDCSHFALSGDTAHCACMEADLAAADIARLCASFAPKIDPETTTQDKPT